MNRRRSERIAFACPVRLNMSTRGILIDLSEGGALLRVPSRQEADRQVTVTIEEGEGTIHAQARILRSTPVPVETESATLARQEYQVAVQFLEFSQQASNAIRQIVSKYRTS